MINTYCSGIQVFGLSTPNQGPFANADVTYCLDEVSFLYQNHMIDGVVNLQGENHTYFRILEEYGINRNHIYIIPDSLTQRASTGEDISCEQLLYPYHEMLPELSEVEVHLADHCNLNCKGCAHFSNLVPKAVFYDKTQFENDVRRLSQLFSQIHRFFLLGGEPLLNPAFCDYVCIVRKYFPYTRIIIVTNGLLVPSLTETQIDILKQNHVILSISAYPVLDLQKITDFVNLHEIQTDIRSQKLYFTKYLNPNGSSDKKAVFDKCPRKECTFLGNGKMAACCQPFTVHYFNEYFGENIPENEWIDIYSEHINGWKILEYLLTPMETCRYCAPDICFEWDISKKPYSKNDWCV